MADGKPAPEPTMEEILSSIRRIIAEDDEKDEAAPRGRGPAGAALSDGVLDLTDVVPEAEPPPPRAVEADPAPVEPARPQADPAPPSAGPGPHRDPAHAREPPSPATPAAGAAMPPSPAQPPDAAESLISAEAAKASAQALARLARASGGDERRPPTGGGLPVEQFLGDLLTPLLRDWLEKNLPGIVERVVEQEVKKLARRAELL